MKSHKKDWKIQKVFLCHKSILLSVLIFCSIYTILEVKFSEKLGNSLDVAMKGDKVHFWNYLLELLCLTGIFLIVRFVYSIVENRYIFHTLKDMRKYAFGYVSEKTPAQFSQVGEGAFTSFFVNDMNLLENSYILPMIHAVTDFISLTLTMIMLLRINMIASLVILFVSFLPLIFTKVMIGGVQEQFGKYAEVMQEYTIHLGEYLEGYEEFLNYNAEEAAIDAHLGYASLLEKSKRKAYLKLDIMSNIIALASIFITIGILLVGMFLALRGMLTVGEVFAISFISNGVSTPLSNLSEHVPKILSVKEIKEKYNDMVSHSKSPEMIPLDKGIEKIQLEDVTLTLDEKTILDHVSVSFEKGKKYVLLGESGSGKSTILKLIAGFFDQYEGVIRVNNHCMRELEKGSLFRQINYVPQQGVVLEDTVYNNISMYRECEKEEVVDAIKKVGFYKRLLEFKEGLQEVLLGGGAELSGGEKQRISLARVMIENDKILFLDEATSALDHESYMEVENKIADLQVPIIISIEHRLEKEILEKYDEIVSMRSGRIVEHGTFAELIEKKGFFYTLYQKQQVED